MRRRMRAFCAIAVVLAAAWPAPAGAQVLPDALPSPAPLSLVEAVEWALRHSPELATLRQQHGIAAAGLVIARTYPFNPIAQSFVWGAQGPRDAGVTNRVFQEYTFRLELELHHQGRHRRAIADATLSRTDWEIANQEAILAIRVIRAFNAYLYRRDKLQVVDEGLRLQEQASSQVGRLVEQGKLGRTELLLTRADMAEARAARGPARTAADLAAQDLRRLLAVLAVPVTPVGSLESPPLRPEPAALVQMALERRPDLQALRLAVEEADGRLRLEVANRFGNPSLGPAFEYNETSVRFVGGYLYYAIPMFNTRRGDVQQRRAERERARLAVLQGEALVQQDVETALTRLADAEALVSIYRTETLPALRSTREAIDKLFDQGEPGVDLARVLDVRRRLLKARDATLDALWEVTQARADLAAALGDPSLAVPSEAPASPPR